MLKFKNKTSNSNKNSEWKEVFGNDEKKLLIQNIDLDSELVKKLWKTELDEKPEFEMYGRKCRMRRNIGFFSNHSKGYQYTNQTAKAKPLTPEMKTLLKRVNQLTGIEFNGLLFNLYIDGNDYIGPHRDDEKNLTVDGVVALSLGATRKFRVRDYRSKEILIDYPTQDSELMWMQGARFHKDFTHEVPIEKRVKSPRLSITFRRHEVD